jgi:hypothetical protein
MGLHSTLFGPVKFAYLPQHLSERELTGGNGMVKPFRRRLFSRVTVVVAPAVRPSTVTPEALRDQVAKLLQVR